MELFHFDDSVEDMREGYMQALAMVSHTGNVFWPPIVKFNGACEIKIKYFPFDDQVRAGIPMDVRSSLLIINSFVQSSEYIQYAFYCSTCEINLYLFCRRNFSTAIHLDI